MKNNLFSGIKPFINKHEPEILLGMGVSGLIFSTVWSVRATTKAVRKLDTLKYELKKEKLTVKEVVTETWRLYLPVAASIALSVPCVIASNKVSSRRNAALAAAFTISEKTLHEYQDKTRQIVGDKKEQEIHESISADRVRDHKGETILITGDGDSLFLEPISGRYFKSSWNKIQKCANELNATALTDICGEITLSDWYDRLGLKNTGLSDDLGWTVKDGSDGLIQVEIDSTLKDDVPCGAIYYRNNPKPLT